MCFQKCRIHYHDDVIRVIKNFRHQRVVIELLVLIFHSLRISFDNSQADIINHRFVPNVLLLIIFSLASIHENIYS